MNVREILVRLRAGHSNRQISRDLDIDRRTVKGYRRWAERQELLTGDLPPVEQLQALLEGTWPEKAPPQNISSVEPYRAVVEKLIGEKVEVAAMRERLKERGYPQGYQFVGGRTRRYIALCSGSRLSCRRPRCGWSERPGKKGKSILATPGG
jgi:hypothetical protein